MSLYDKASLVQIPSGTKSGKLYSVLPANGNGDFTHTRGSSATRVNKDGLIESVASGVPRLDYPLIDGVVQDCPALLLEPSRTNDLQRTEEFDNSYWGKSNGTATANQTISPDGSQNADRFAENTSTASHLISRSSISIASGAVHTLSVFAKANGRNTFRLFADTGGNSFFAFFNLETKNIGSKQGLTGGAKIEEYPNDWYRCSISFTSTTTSAYVQFLLTLDNETTSYTGDGSSGMYFWGAQLEEGSYETSYIPTSGSAVTRSADECNGAGTSAEFNDSEGVLFVEIQALVDDGSLRLIQINDGSTVNNIVTLGYNSAFGQLLVQIRSGGGTTNVFTHNITDVTLYNKLALKYEQNTATLYVNGFEAFSSSIIATPIGLSELDFDYNGGFPVYARTKQLMTFNQALTDSELEQITSWTSFGEMAKGQLYTIQ